jgi:hypothetical protein
MDRGGSITQGVVAYAPAWDKKKNCGTLQMLMIAEKMAINQHGQPNTYPTDGTKESKLIM